MGLADMNVQATSVPHGGKGSGCCCWCDRDLVVTVHFENGEVARARRFEPSPLGKGFARIQALWPGRTTWQHGAVLTPRDTVER